MKLSELHTGESGVIVKVTGHGGFRKRIVEMGFIKGQKVEVLLNAPLKDPVKYRIMGYEVSLRHSEADMIEVVSEEEARKLSEKNAVQEAQKEQEFSNDAEPASKTIDSKEPDEQPLPRVSDEQMKQAAEEKRKVINVALVGNPNCGKTSSSTLPPVLTSA